MKINTLTLKNIIKEEIENVINPQQIPTPESMGFERLDLSVAQSALNDIESAVDLSGLVRFISQNFNMRTLEESERLSSQKKAMIRRRRRSREQETSDFEMQPLKTKTPGERIKENVNIIRNGSAIERTGGLYMENIAALQEELKTSSKDKELIQSWIEIFLYEASNPILKKYLPNMTKFTIDSYDQIIEFVKDQKTKAKLKAKEVKERTIKKIKEIPKRPNFFLDLAMFGFPPAYIGILFSMIKVAKMLPQGSVIAGYLGAFFLIGIVMMVPLYVTAMSKGSQMDRNK
tara:strand:- start:38 stop:904 length:867 start_codon:yes stop_codon:yes gene_type:complete